MERRTDLALEAAEQPVLQETLTDRDVERERFERGNAALTRIHIRSERGERALGKPRGTYITAELPALTDNETELEETARLIGEQLAALLPEEGTVLVVGLGNEAITPMRWGLRRSKMVLATRHIQGEFARAAGLDDLRPTAVMAPGVLGNTGVESGEMAEGVITVVPARPPVVAIDALAARSLSRLGCTVQISDTGIAPGSGVGNNRRELNRDTLGIPVIAVGVPTVVDAVTLAEELTGREDMADEVSPRGAGMMVTPREIDLMIRPGLPSGRHDDQRGAPADYSPLELAVAAQ